MTNYFSQVWDRYKFVNLEIVKKKSTEYETCLSWLIEHIRVKGSNSKKTTTYIDGNPGPGFRQEQKCPTVAELNQPVVALYLILIVQQIVLLQGTSHN